MRIDKRDWKVPAGLLGLCIFSFGLLIPSLGFYWDDWPVLLTRHIQGLAGYWTFYQHDRPVSAWTYVVTIPLLGDNPIAWQLFTLALRWLTAVIFWFCLILLWPGRRREMALAASLFVIYPVFTQQFISVAYSQHWICYLLFAISLAAMVKGWRSPRWYWPLTTVGVSTALLGLMTMEYFAGLELVRPLLLWILASEGEGNTRKKLKIVLRHWLPYLVGLVVFFTWRFFLLNFPGEAANSPFLLYEMLRNPVSGGVHFLQLALQDFVYLFLPAWAKTVSPTEIDLTNRFALFSWAMAILAITGSYFFLRWYGRSTGEQDSPSSTPGWAWTAVLLGISMILLGILPVWLTDRQVIVGMYSDRFALPAMMGTSLVIVGLLGVFEITWKKQILLVSLLVGLAVGQHLRIANDFRWARIQQERFYWQLYWRAPWIEPKTAIMAYAEILPKMGLYSTASGINLIYAGQKDSSALDYWFFSISRPFSYRMAELLHGSKIKNTFRNYTFETNPNNSLVVFYEPDKADCLRVLTQADGLDPALQAEVVRALPITNLARIRPQPAPGRFPSENIFGPEPDHGWCYFFEKADLARQLQDWQQVAALGDQAREKGFSLANGQSNTPQEWLPFIEGYAHTGRWQDAGELSQSALEKEPKMGPRLCELWDDLSARVSNNEEANRIQGVLHCKE